MLNSVGFYSTKINYDEQDRMSVLEDSEGNKTRVFYKIENEKLVRITEIEKNNSEKLESKEYKDITGKVVKTSENKFGTTI